MGLAKRILDLKHVDRRIPGGLQVKFETHGFAAMDEMLAKLPAKPALNAIGVAVRFATRPVVKMAIALAPDDTGTLKKNIKVKARAYRATNTYVAVTGPRYFLHPNGRNPGKYHHLVERGFKHWRSGERIGGTRYMERAFEYTRATQLARFKRKLPLQIEKEITKLKARMVNKFAPWPGYSS